MPVLVASSAGLARAVFSVNFHLPVAPVAIRALVAVVVVHVPVLVHVPGTDVHFPNGDLRVPTFGGETAPLHAAMTRVIVYNR